LKMLNVKVAKRSIRRRFLQSRKPFKGSRNAWVVMAVSFLRASGTEPVIRVMVEARARVPPVRQRLKLQKW